jgi:competence protein ComFC
MWVSFRRLSRQFATALLDVILPPVCPGCGKPSGGKPSGALCRPCRYGLELRRLGGCRRCGEVLRADGRCPADHLPLRNLDQVLSPLAFRGTGGQLVRRFKLQGDASAGRWLVRAMVDRYRVQASGRKPLVLSVPLHRARLRRRGFDQAAWLADRVADRLRLRRGLGVLVRNRWTRPQGDPRVMSRAANVRGAFTVRDTTVLAGRSVLLVDDVMTTGATARACARLLIEAGARDVVLLVACRS